LRTIFEDIINIPKNENGAGNDFYFEPTLLVEELFKFYELKNLSKIA